MIQALTKQPTLACRVSMSVLVRRRVGMAMILACCTIGVVHAENIGIYPVFHDEFVSYAQPPFTVLIDTAANTRISHTDGEPIESKTITATKYFFRIPTKLEFPSDALLAPNLAAKSSYWNTWESIKMVSYEFSVGQERWSVQPRAYVFETIEAKSFLGISYSYTHKFGQYFSVVVQNNTTIPLRTRMVLGGNTIGNTGGVSPPRKSITFNLSIPGYAETRVLIDPLANIAVDGAHFYSR